MLKGSSCLEHAFCMHLVSRFILFMLALTVLCTPALGALFADFTATPFATVAAGSLLYVDASLSRVDLGNSLVLYEWQWASSDSYTGQPAEDFSFTPNATGIQQSHLFGSIGTYRVTLRITDDQSDKAIAQKYITVEARQSPHAVHSFSSYEIEAGMDLFLDGTASYDSDTLYGDMIVKYEWILAGRTLANGPCLTISWTTLEAALISSGYPTPENGNIWETIKLKVTDTTGRYHEASALLHINSVPEPATMGLLALGWLTMVRRGRSA